MDKTLSLIFTNLAPIFILILIGIWIRYINMIKEGTIDELKTIIINISLPAILFFAFLKIELQSSYIIIFVVIFVLCLVLFMVGFIVKSYSKNLKEYTPYLMTGFEFGMMGTVFFLAAFGRDKLGYIGIIALGHEFFIWFVYVTLLIRKRDDKVSLKNTLKNFTLSPVIIAIFLGIFCNLLNIREFLEKFFISQAIFRSLDYLTGLTVPIILIIIGYGLKLNLKIFLKVFPILILRIVAVLTLALLIDLFIFKKLLHLESIFSAALYIFFILPPPFILPLFIRKEHQEDKVYINGALLIYSIISIMLFSIYFIIYHSV